MGIILKFEAPRNRGRRVHSTADRAAPCEIIILPCVRYEHPADNTQTPKPQKKKARKPRARAERRAQ